MWFTQEQGDLCDLLEQFHARRAGMANLALSERHVLVQALLSRIILILIAIIFGLLVEDYDTSTHLQLGNYLAPLDGVIFNTFGHLARWDSVYFLQIAEKGYEYEQYHAFFPALPLAIKFVKNTGEAIWFKDRSVFFLN